jgi:hypothetical protein
MCCSLMPLPHRSRERPRSLRALSATISRRASSPMNATPTRLSGQGSRPSLDLRWRRACRKVPAARWKAISHQLEPRSLFGGRARRDQDEEPRLLALGAGAGVRVEASTRTAVRLILFTRIAAADRPGRTALPGSPRFDARASGLAGTAEPTGESPQGSQPYANASPCS